MRRRRPTTSRSATEAAPNRSMTAGRASMRCTMIRCSPNCWKCTANRGSISIRMPGSNVHKIGLRWGNEHEGIVGKLSKKNGKSRTNTAIGSTAGGPQTRERNLKSLGAAPPSFAKVHNFAGTLAAAKLTGKLCKGHAAGGGCGILRSAGWRERKPMKLKLVVLALAIVCASQAAADSFNAFYSFGDSSVD